MISRTNWEISKENYTDLTKGLKSKTKEARRQAISAYNATACGYCFEHGAGRCGTDADCIFGSYDTCADSYGGWKATRTALSNEDIETALPIAERILQAIIDDEVNVYEDKGE